MPIEWTQSAEKHGITHEDALYAISHAEGVATVKGHPGELTQVFVGHPHAQTHRYIEVIVATRPPRTLTVFHAMPLTDLYRHLIGE